MTVSVPSKKINSIFITENGAVFCTAPCFHLQLLILIIRSRRNRNRSQRQIQALFRSSGIQQRLP